MSALETLVTPLGWLLRAKRPDQALSVRNRPELTTTGRLRVTSAAFDEGGRIPDRHAGEGRGDNVSPALAWTGAPEATRQLLLVMEDRDVPFTRPILHLVALFAPQAGGAGAAGAGAGVLAEGVLVPSNPAMRFVPGFRGRTGYQGPRALPGHGTHRYGFHLYALDAQLPPDTALASLDDVLPLVAGHVLASGVVEGTQRG